MLFRFDPELYLIALKMPQNYKIFPATNAVPLMNIFSRLFLALLDRLPLGGFFPITPYHDHAEKAPDDSRA